MGCERTTMGTQNTRCVEGFWFEDKKQYLPSPQLNLLLESSWLLLCWLAGASILPLRGHLITAIQIPGIHGEVTS